MIFAYRKQNSLSIYNLSTLLLLIFVHHVVQLATKAENVINRLIHQAVDNRHSRLESNYGDHIKYRTL